MFFRILVDFLIEFPLFKNCKKRVYKPAGADVASGPRWRPSGARTASGCDAALRPRGRARVAHAGRVWRALTRGRVPRGQATQTPVRGATWREAGKWRAHGLVGPG